MVFEKADNDRFSLDSLSNSIQEDIFQHSSKAFSRDWFSPTLSTSCLSHLDDMLSRNTIDFGPIGGNRVSSLSNNSPNATTSLAQEKVNSSRYKTELCRPFGETGTCKYGDKCQFAHGPQDMRSINRHPKYKTDLCRTYYSTGICPYGSRCHFVHNIEDIPVSSQNNSMYFNAGENVTLPAPLYSPSLSEDADFRMSLDGRGGMKRVDTVGRTLSFAESGYTSEGSSSGSRVSPAELDFDEYEMQAVYGSRYKRNIRLPVFNNVTAK